MDYDQDDGDDAKSVSSGSEAASETSTSRSASASRARDSNSLEEAIPMLARGETQAVKRLRWLTIGVLVIVAAVCCASVYVYTRNVEKASFDEEFASSGLKVIDAFQDDSFRKLDALHSLSNTLTAYTLDENVTWPFVTLDSSAQILAPYLSLAGAASITILPVVPADQRAQWEAYSVKEQGWIEKDYKIRTKEQKNKELESSARRRLEAADLATTDRALQQQDRDKSISPYIKNYVGIDLSNGPWFVWWQYAPVIKNKYFINFNRLATKGFSDLSLSLFDGFAAISSTFTIVPGLDIQSSSDYFFVNDMLEAGSDGSYGVGEPLSYIYYPVFRDFENKALVAGIESMVYWRSYFEYILPDKVRGIIVVVKNTINESFSYQINGKEAAFLGLNDTHDDKYDDMMLRADYTSFQDEQVEATTNRDYMGVKVDGEHIRYWIEVYPSVETEEVYLTSRPLIYTLAMVFFFSLTTSIFLLYDWYVERRQRIVLTSALKSNAVVASMFPKNVRDRLYENAHVDANNKKDKFALDKEVGLVAKSVKSMPIADFYPDTTICFADIRGFTAWSSTREPAQVFTLLETIYNAFDDIAKRRGVFKVETVGDCYMAVCGVPTFKKDHAVVMARFAKDCLTKFNQLVRKLETSLGPDTAELQVRTGLHSGPVTGGVIRGENVRFQLFGDTVNTAARMESTGEPGRIQVSHETAELLVAGGKARWLVEREDSVLAKGKGVLTTYWLSIGENGAVSSANTRSTGSGSETDTSEVERVVEDDMDISKDPFSKTHFNEKSARLVSWNVDLLTNLLLDIQAGRDESSHQRVADIKKLEQKFKKSMLSNDKRTIEEVKDIITLPEIDTKAGKAQKQASVGKLHPRIVDQLQSYVQCLANMYRPNPFHNFEHASHVTMSVSKLLARIVKPKNPEQDSSGYGISSDSLVQFSCVLAALIHDVDHAGVPNAQLVKEGSQLADFYHGKSVAEQNSVDLAWELLLDEGYTQLRAAIYSNEQEMVRFRSLIVNTVMATDIVDKDLKALRDGRWAKAFSESAAGSTAKVDIDRKATIVIEHLIQASDVSHTMQHWHIYRKWNERFFVECYKAFKEGRAEKDPSEFWYKGEIGFFDFYIIPLAKKLKDCGVFGVSSDEYLSYAMRNRKEWESKGEAVVAEMISSVEKRLADQEELASTVKNNSLTTIEETAIQPVLEPAPALTSNDFSSGRIFL